MELLNFEATVKHILSGFYPIDLEKINIWRGKPIHERDSGNKFSLVEANGTIIIPQGKSNLPEDSMVKGYFLEDF